MGETTRSWLIDRRMSDVNISMLTHWMIYPSLIIESRYPYVDSMNKHTAWAFDQFPDWFGAAEFRFMPPPLKLDHQYHMEVVYDEGVDAEVYEFENVVVSDIDCRRAMVEICGGFRRFKGETHAIKMVEIPFSAISRFY